MWYLWHLESWCGIHGAHTSWCATLIWKYDVENLLDAKSWCETPDAKSETQINIIWCDTHTGIIMWYCWCDTLMWGFVMCPLHIKSWCGFHVESVTPINVDAKPRCGMLMLYLWHNRELMRRPDVELLHIWIVHMTLMWISMWTRGALWPSDDVSLAQINSDVESWRDILMCKLCHK